jgi:hypothetical protein
MAIVAVGNAQRFSAGQKGMVKGQAIQEVLLPYEEGRYRDLKPLCLEARRLVGS